MAGRPLRAVYANSTYSTGVREMSDADINDVIAPIVLDYIWYNASLISGASLRFVNSNDPLLPGEVVRSSVSDTMNAGVPGDHYSEPSQPVQMIQWDLRQNEIAANTNIANFVRPVTYAANGSIVEMTDDQIRNNIASVIVNTMITGGVGGYFLGPTAPATGSWLEVGVGIDQRWVSSAGGIEYVDFILWQRVDVPTIGTIRPLSINSSSSSLKEMSNSDILKLAGYVASYINTTGIGHYRLAETSPTPGTWLNRGSFIDTINQQIEQSYAGAYVTPYTRVYTTAYTSSFAGSFTVMPTYASNAYTNPNPPALTFVVQYTAQANIGYTSGGLFTQTNFYSGAYVGSVFTSNAAQYFGELFFTREDYFAVRYTNVAGVSYGSRTLVYTSVINTFAGAPRYTNVRQTFSPGNPAVYTRIEQGGSTFAAWYTSNLPSYTSFPYTRITYADGQMIATAYRAVYTRDSYTSNLIYTWSGDISFAAQYTRTPPQYGTVYTNAGGSGFIAAYTSGVAVRYTAGIQYTENLFLEFFVYTRGAYASYPVYTSNTNYTGSFTEKVFPPYTGSTAVGYTALTDATFTSALPAYTSASGTFQRQFTSSNFYSGSSVGSFPLFYSGNAIYTRFISYTLFPRYTALDSYVDNFTGRLFTSGLFTLTGFFTRNVGYNTGISFAGFFQGLGYFTTAYGSPVQYVGYYFGIAGFFSGVVGRTAVFTSARVYTGLFTLSYTGPASYTRQVAVYTGPVYTGADTYTGDGLGVYTRMVIFETNLTFTQSYGNFPVFPVYTSIFVGYFYGQPVYTRLGVGYAAYPFGAVPFSATFTTQVEGYVAVVPYTTQVPVNYSNSYTRDFFDPTLVGYTQSYGQSVFTGSTTTLYTLQLIFTRLFTGAFSMTYSTPYTRAYTGGYSGLTVLTATETFKTSVLWVRTA